MSKRSLPQRMMRFMAAVAIGGSAFQLSGCDSAVRETILTGLESTTQTLASSLVSAFFQTLSNNSAG